VQRINWQNEKSFAFMASHYHQLSIDSDGFAAEKCDRSSKMQHFLPEYKLYIEQKIIDCFEIMVF
jgi:hypothetical protein